MSEYFVIKREKCERCKGFGTVKTPNVPQPIGECSECKGVKYIESQVDLLDVLAKVRWDALTRDEGIGILGQFEHLRIEE